MGRKQDTWESLACDLLGATVWIGFKVLHQPGRKSPGGGRNGDITFVEVGVEVSLRSQVAFAQKTPRLHQRDQRRRRSHADIGAQPRAAAFVLRHEYHTG